MNTLRLLIATVLLSVIPACAQPPAGASSSLLLIGADGQSTSLSAAQLSALQQITVRVHDAHSSRDESYQGVALPLLLQRMHAPLGNKLHGAALTMYVVAEGSDHYRALYSLAELDPAFHPGTVIVAERMDGKLLDAKNGPFKLVNTEDRRPARWVRNLAWLRLVQAPAPAGSQPLEASLAPAPR